MVSMSPKLLCSLLPVSRSRTSQHRSKRNRHGRSERLTNVTQKDGGLVLALDRGGRYHLATAIKL